MAFPSPLLFPSDSLFPSAFAPPPPPPSVGGLEQLALDDIELNDGNPWTVMRELAIDWTPPKKKLNWIDSPLADGAALAGSEDHYENAELVLTVGLARQTSKDAALRLLHTLTQKLQQARRTPGGLPLTWTPSGSSSSLTYYVVEAEYEEYDIHREEGWFTNAPTFRIHLYLRPFGYGSEEQLELGYSDQFLFNSLTGGPWRIDNGTGELGVFGGYLACTGVTDNKRLYLPYTAEDVQVAIRVQVNAGYGLGGLRLKRTAPFTHIAVMIDEANNKLQIRKYYAGTTTVLQGVDFTPTAGNYYWLVGTVQDNTVFAGIYEDGTIDAGDPSVSVTHDLTTTTTDVSGTPTSDASLWGTGVRGQPGIHLVPTSTGGVVIDQFRLTGMSDVTTGEPVASLDLVGIAGDVDAEARQAVTEASTQKRDHYEWGLESLQYDPTLTWPYVLDSAALVTTGFNGSKTLVGGNVYDPFVPATGNMDVITSGGLSSTTPVTICSTPTGAQALRHVGAYKVKARVSNAIPNSTLRLRLSWRTGEGSYTTNDYTEDVNPGGFYEVDLGMVNIVQTGLVNQTWNGLIQAYATSGTALLVIDYLMLIPLESWGTARNPTRPVVADTFTALDHFNRAASGTLGTADAGGAWANAVGTGMALSGFNAYRSTTGDTISQGNKVTLSSSYGPIQLQVDTNSSILNAEATGYYRAGVLARYNTIPGPASNWVAAVLTNVLNPGNPFGPTIPPSQSLRLIVMKSINGGAPVFLGTKNLSDNPAVPKTVLLNVDAAGFWQAYVFNVGAKQSSRPTLQGQDADMVAGGAAGTGKIGLYDACGPSGGQSARSYDNFVAYAPPVDAVLFPARHLEVRSDRTIRESSTGGSFGKVPRYFGDRFFLPPAGAAHDVTRLAWKARRSDVDGGAPDTSAPGSDATTLSIFATPRYLLPSGGG